METIVLNKTNLYPGIDPTVDPICELQPGDVVKFIQNTSGWSKIQIQNQTGYVSRKDIDQTKNKQGNIVVSIPFECANALYEALKYALKK